MEPSLRPDDNTRDHNLSKSLSTKLALRTSVVYLLVAGLWIVLSDRILQPVAPFFDTYVHWQTIKGLLFVFVTGTLLFFAVRAQLREIEQAHHGLSLAYDTTLEGWSRALDLRDKETEGHTQRVTELAVRLAERLGIQDEELLHIRRGALLHDIGKLGVPDHILFKGGALEQDDLEVMKQHPLHAYNLLFPIAYLRPALDIPYRHHERWDGSGYPDGLIGTEIPLAARIFAVVDVWDALTSDRPYRKAWTPQRAFRYLQEQSGQQFDPSIVEAFLAMMAEGEQAGLDG